MNTKTIKFQDDGEQAYCLPEQAVEIFERFYESGAMGMVTFSNHGNVIIPDSDPSKGKVYTFALEIESLKEPGFFSDDLKMLAKHNWISQSDPYQLTRYGVSKYLEWKGKDKNKSKSKSKSKDEFRTRNDYGYIQNG